MTKLTKRTADLAAAGDKLAAIWDEELRGFGLRVYPNGRKVYVVKCRIKGQQRFITLGQHGPVTADQARTRAYNILSEAKNGRDPAKEGQLVFGSSLRLPTPNEPHLTSRDINDAERQLWCAVISRAVFDATDRVAAASAPSECRRLREDARRWFNQNGRDFRAACESAGYDPDFLRSRVLSMMADGIKRNGGTPARAP